jgi:hypothetical protein
MIMGLGYHVIWTAGLWVAFGPDFTDSEHGALGCGDTPFAAISEWLKLRGADRRSCGSYYPRIEDFEVHREDEVDDEHDDREDASPRLVK